MDATTSKIINKFLQHFEPAASLSEADEQMTTEQIYEKINSFYPDAEFVMDDLFKRLNEVGFQFEWINGEFKWMLKEIV
jgi:hypothetical protein